MDKFLGVKYLAQHYSDVFSDYGLSPHPLCIRSCPSELLPFALGGVAPENLLEALISAKRTPYSIA